eukprot:CAMPEP_0201497082 /NCGR_PEP_ID=MMETSP0151_2-20130828/63496_1 /ASSEMBLY_ACC=CAM_ASM_000257 /TAXON_ID=200890 /ORGANISM="Paramoeba atlantica, Strain 621/1 / CCAP 1560/9" /LENGTH=127 /DNA_ID=CAMNT_0047887435 /DNA_START=36 /DNA_END=416 /DNA_ORIENTATION=+
MQETSLEKPLVKDEKPDEKTSSQERVPDATPGTLKPSSTEETEEKGETKTPGEAKIEGLSLRASLTPRATTSASSSISPSRSSSPLNANASAYIPSTKAKERAMMKKAAVENSLSGTLSREKKIERT